MTVFALAHEIIRKTTIANDKYLTDTFSINMMNSLIILIGVVDD
jgi:hypothetical protein